MNLKKLLVLVCVSLFTLNTQAQNTTNNPCGVDLQESIQIKERMLENRRNVPQAEIDAFQNSRNIKYLPVKLHVVRNANGEGGVSLVNMMAMLCDMNNDFRSQNVQFYLQGVSNSVNFMNNDAIYNDGGSGAASIAMFNAKSSGAVNIFISASVNNQIASYYTGLGDFVFILNSMCNGTSSTGTHEVGHYFTLPHTFFGWEGNDATVYSPGNVPNSVGGQAVERVARSGVNANCSFAGDGFCDTPADYLSDRSPCPFSGTLNDPLGVQIDPEESNFMSYFFDACVDSFTAQQKSAMAADILSRWATFNPPAITTPPSPAGITATSPANNGSAALNGDLTITWAAAPNATGYIFELERTFSGVPIGTVVETIVYTNSITIPEADLTFPQEYTWNVRPFNQYETCNGVSSNFKFSTTAPVGITAHEAFAQNASLTIAQNPISSFTAELFIHTPEALVAGLSIYSIDGKQLVNLEGLELNAGDNAQLIEVGSLPNGVYIINLQTELGSLQQKMVIQR